LRWYTTCIVIPLLNEFDQRRISRSRGMSVEQRFLETSDLIRDVRNRMLDGIRAQFPGLGDAELEREFQRRLRINRHLENTAPPRPSES
jgi:hypothetical protein